MADLAEFAARWEAMARPDGDIGTGFVASTQPDRNVYYKPLVDAADEFVRWAQSPHERIYLGFPEIDAEMRGIAPGELALIIGYSHSGKTTVLMQILEANKDKFVAYFVPDEPRTLTLIKLTCLTHSVNAIELERGISNDESWAIDLLRQTATDHFPTLAVFDQSMAISDMEKSMAELVDMWGQKPDLVVFDYLELLQGGGEDVPSKANTLKAWGRRHDVPMLVLHQTARTSGADGKRLTISSGAFGGEQQATHIVGVRRKRFELEARIRELEAKLDKSQVSERAMEELDLLRYEVRLHQHTLTTNLVKVKRPGGRLLDEIDYEIEDGTGRLSRITDGELPVQYLREVRSA